MFMLVMTLYVIGSNMLQKVNVNIEICLLLVKATKVPIPVTHSDKSNEEGCKQVNQEQLERDNKIM